MSKWPVKTFGDLFDSKPKSSESLKQKDYLSTGTFPVVDQGHELIGGFTNDQHLVRDFETPVIIFGDHTRCVKYVDFPFASGADGTKILVPRNGVDPKYAYFQLLSIELPIKGYARHFGELSKCSFVLPPLEEQKRIVALLDAATACVTELTACYEQARTHANNLFTSALRDALEGNPDWPVKTLGSMFRVCSSKRVLKSEWKQSGVPFYRGREITALSKHGFVENELFISEEHFSDLVQKYGVPKTGDIMITAIGTIGNSYVVKEADRFYFKDASVIWLDKQTEIMSSYVQYWVRSSRFRDQLNAGNGATVDTLTIDGLSKMQIPVPPLAEQKRIVAQLDSMRTKTSEMVAAYDAKLNAAKNLRQSILEAAFEGAL